MKVTLVVPDFRGLAGGMRVVGQYATHLMKAGHDVAIVSRQVSTGPEGRRSRLRRIFRLNRPRLGPTFEVAGHFGPVRSRVTHYPAYYPLTEQVFPDADIIVATWWETVEWIRDLPPEKGRQIHFIQDHEDFHYLPAARTEAVYRAPTLKIVVASWLIDVMRDRYGQSAVLCPNGVDTAWYDTRPRAPTGAPQVGFLYSPHPRKNINLALAAVELARARHPALRCLAFGAHLPRQAFPDWIEFHSNPPQADIPKLYAACDAWLFPSLSEGFGLPLLEAMACRTPVLATRAGAATDLVGPENGRLLDADPQVFADAITDVAGLHPLQWRAQSDAARSVALRHDLTSAAKGFEAALTAMI